MEPMKWRGNPKTIAACADFMHNRHAILAWSPSILYYSHVRSQSAIISYTALQAALEEHQKQLKQRVIQYELKKPFLEKLYQLCGREV